ncbi:MAG: helix-turn-helix transcriptional regulator [Ruminococcaceae bacterium]|nr:helix-turn-helix transcriptional regulator [Oscillospiraceae bacterium]
MKQIILPNIVSIGIYNAQIAMNNKTVSKNRKTTMFEIELPVESGGISYIDDSQHTILENVVICAKPGQLRHTKLPFKCYYIHMILNEGKLFDLLSFFPDYIEIENPSEIREIFIQMCNHYNASNPESEIILQSLILRLIYALNKHSLLLNAKHTPKQNNHTTINKIIEYINGNLTADLKLEVLAKKANFSPVYFHKLFKASTGRTLREYIEGQKIKKSIEMLTSTDLTLTDIAYECGFSSQSYFSYAFKKKMNVTPREYVKNILKEYEV